MHVEKSLPVPTGVWSMEQQKLHDYYNIQKSSAPWHALYIAGEYGARLAGHEQGMVNHRRTSGMSMSPWRLKRPLGLTSQRKQWLTLWCGRGMHQQRTTPNAGFLPVKLRLHHTNYFDENSNTQLVLFWRAMEAIQPQATLASRIRAMSLMFGTPRKTPQLLGWTTCWYFERDICTKTGEHHGA